MIGQSVWLSVSQHITGSGASEQDGPPCLVLTPPLTMLWACDLESVFTFDPMKSDTTVLLTLFGSQRSHKSWTVLENQATTKINLNPPWTQTKLWTGLIPEPAAPQWRCVPQQQPCAAGSYLLWCGHPCWHQLSAIHPQWSNDHAEPPGGVGTSPTTGQGGRDTKTDSQTSNSWPGFHFLLWSFNNLTSKND